MRHTRGATGCCLKWRAAWAHRHCAASILCMHCSRTASASPLRVEVASRLTSPLSAKETHGASTSGRSTVTTTLSWRCDHITRTPGGTIVRPSARAALGSALTLLGAPGSTAAMRPPQSYGLRRELIFPRPHPGPPVSMPNQRTHGLQVTRVISIGRLPSAIWKPARPAGETTAQTS